MECDGFLTAQKKLGKNATHIEAQLGLKVLWPAVGFDAFEVYATRLAAIEGAHVARAGHSFDGAAAARAAPTWRELQLVQLEHDRAYHFDVLGLSRADHLRHYAFHVAKLAGAFARAARGEAGEAEIVERRLPDILLRDQAGDGDGRAARRRAARGPAGRCGRISDPPTRRVRRQGRMPRPSDS